MNSCAPTLGWNLANAFGVTAGLKLTNAFGIKAKHVHACYAVPIRLNTPQL